MSALQTTAVVAPRSRAPLAVITQSSVAEHVTVRTSGFQFSAQFRSVRPCLRDGADPHGTHLTYEVTYNEVRFTASEDRRVLQLQFTIASERFGVGRAADHFHAPRFHRFSFQG